VLSFPAAPIAAAVAGGRRSSLGKVRPKD